MRLGLVFYEPVSRFSKLAHMQGFVRVSAVCVTSVKVTCICEKLRRELYGVKKRELFPPPLQVEARNILFYATPVMYFSGCVLLQKMQESAKCYKI